MKFKLLRAKGSSVATLDITDLIGLGGYYASDLRDALAAAKGVKNITVRLSSDGGSITEGLAIYNMLAQHPAKVRVEVIGIAASMGSVIAMAGDEICMAEDSFMMIHNPSGGVDGESGDMRETADLLDKMRDMIARIYERRTGQKLDVIKKAMAAETWMTAAEALKLGYCTALIPATKMTARLKVRAFKRTPKALRRARNQGEENMDPELLKELGLAEDATEEDVIAAIKALKAAAVEDDDKPDDDDDKPEDSEGDDDKPDDDDDNDGDKDKEARARREAAAALRNRRGGSNRRGSVVERALTAIVDRLERIERRSDDGERERLIAANVKKFSPALEKKARKWPMNVLRDYIKDAEDRPDASTEPETPTGRGPSSKSKDKELTEAEIRIAKLCGNNPDDLKAFKNNGMRLVKKTG